MDLLQSMRDILDRTFGSGNYTVTSGYRGPNHPLTLKNPGSAHSRGYATDFVVPGMSSQDAARRLAQVMGGSGFDQIIDERNHVHLSLDPRGRGMLLSEPKEGTYVPGLGGGWSINSTLPANPKAKGSGSVVDAISGGSTGGGVVGSVAKSSGLDPDGLIGRGLDMAASFLGSGDATTIANFAAGNPLAAFGSMAGNAAGDMWQQIVETVKKIFDNIVKRITEALEPWISRGTIGIVGLALIFGALIIFAAQSGVVDKATALAAKAL